MGGRREEDSPSGMLKFKAFHEAFVVAGIRGRSQALSRDIEKLSRAERGKVCEQSDATHLANGKNVIKIIIIIFVEQIARSPTQSSDEALLAGTTTTRV